VLWAAHKLLNLARAGTSPTLLRRAMFDVLDVLEKRGSRDQIDTAANAIVDPDDGDDGSVSHDLPLPIREH